MWTFSKLAATFVACAALGLIGCGTEMNQEVKAPGPVFIDNYSAVLDSMVPGLLDRYSVPALGVAVIRNGEIELTKVFGEHQLGRPAPDDAIFNVASITKPVVATTVMKLVENGAWDLDAPLHQYYTDPDIADDDRARLITTRHCLSHTAGFKNWRWDEPDGKLRINSEPGERYSYSGEGMELLRRAMEAKFGTGLERIVDSLLFTPLGMQDATMRWLAPEDTIRFAHWFDARGQQHDINHRIDRVNAADDLLVSVRDMALFGKAVMNGSVLGQEAYRKMTSPQIAINDKRDQGLGWVLHDGIPEIGTLLNHDGGDPGVVATLILIPDHQSGIALFTNGDNGASLTSAVVDRIFHHGREIIQGLHWENDIPQSVSLPRDSVERFAGTYRTDHGFDITFTPADGGLLTHSPVFPRLTFFPRNANEFFALPFEIYFRFVERDGGMQLQLMESDREVSLRGTRVEAR